MHNGLSKGLYRVSVWAACFFGAFCFLYFGKVGLERIVYPYQLNLGESPLSQAVMFLARGENPYRDLLKPPYFLVPYGPVYLFFASILYRLVESPYVGGRLIAYAATFGCAFLIFSILRRVQVRKTPSFLAASLFLAHPFIDRWGVQVNVDITGVFVDLAALFFFVGYTQSGRRRDWVAGCVLAVAAFFTKSSMVCAPGAFFLYLIFQKRFRSALALLGTIGGMAGIVFLALQASTHGHYGFHTIYEIAHRSFYYQFILWNWKHAWVSAPLFIFASLWTVQALFRRRAPEILPLFLCVGAFLSLSMGKQGSDTNYLLSWTVAAAMASGLWLDRWRSKMPLLGSLLALAMAVQLGVLAWPKRDMGGNRLAEQKAFFDKISAIVKMAPDPVLCEDMSLLIANHRTIYYEPFPFGQMSYSKVWDQAPILKDLNNRIFSMAILYTYMPGIQRSRTFNEAFTAAFNRNYEIASGVALPWNSNVVYFFYKPRGGAK